MQLPAHLIVVYMYVVCMKLISTYVPGQGVHNMQCTYHAVLDHGPSSMSTPGFLGKPFFKTKVWCRQLCPQTVSHPLHSPCLTCVLQDGGGGRPGGGRLGGGRPGWIWNTCTLPWIRVRDCAILHLLVCCGVGVWNWGQKYVHGVKMTACNYVVSVVVCSEKDYILLA